MNDNNKDKDDMSVSRLRGVTFSQDITALPKGPWDEELDSYVKSRKMVVLVHNLELETIEHEFIVDYGNYEHRKFLGRLTYYGITNKRSIESMSIDEWEKMNK